MSRVRSSPFKTLSDDPILHIFSFLPGADLLKLSGMNKTFNRIITKSVETMSKIRLVLDFNNGAIDLDYAIKLAQTQRFTGLRLKSVDKITDADAKVTLVSLLELLSGSVDDLAVEGEISRELLSSIIAMFIPKLKKCKLENVTFDAEAAPIIEEIRPKRSVNHPLESLELIKTRAEVVRFFAGCNQLKIFHCAKKYQSGNDIEILNNFLAKQQDRLEKLDYRGELAWDQLKCFQLKELKADCLCDDDDQLAAAMFLEKLPNLTTLDIGFFGHPSRPLMRAICFSPKLDTLTVRRWSNDNEDEDEDEDEYEDEDEDEDEDMQERLVNRTVDKLNLLDYSGHPAKLLKFFESFESAWICAICENPESGNPIFKFKFSPRNIPKNVRQFKLYVAMLSKSLSYMMTGIEIGHANWRNSRAFDVKALLRDPLIVEEKTLDTFLISLFLL